MKVNITARHLELTPALREYAEKRLQQVKKYTSKITTVHIIFNVEKDRHIAEVILHISRNKINARAIAGDMYAAIDIVMDKIIKQLRRHKDRVKEHRDMPSYSMLENLVQSERKKNEENESRVEDIKEVMLQRHDTNRALDIMEEKKLGFWVFEDSKTESVSIVYRRDNGGYAMIVVK
ncbi:MAG: ribosome-associated translation inhibitor RaiA [Elusimicrobia bacterium]|nr:ribosome-associated translation inhibitor RaiA [Elusimicrobiota bacterium]